jgi:DNA-binding NtrC family response regulator
MADCLSIANCGTGIGKHNHPSFQNIKPWILKRPILFIGYEPFLRDEIRDFLKDRAEEAYFSESKEDTLRIMQTTDFETVVLNMQRLEDAAILRYINMHYQKTHVLIVPGRELQDAIPALASGQYELMHTPFRLEELKSFIE